MDPLSNKPPIIAETQKKDENPPIQDNQAHPQHVNVEQRTQSIWKSILSAILLPVRAVRFVIVKLGNAGGKILSIAARIFPHWKKVEEPVTAKVEKPAKVQEPEKIESPVNDKKLFQELLKGKGIYITPTEVGSEEKPLKLPQQFVMDVTRVLNTLTVGDEKKGDPIIFQDPKDIPNAFSRHIELLTPNQLENYARIATQSSNIDSTVKVYELLARQEDLNMSNNLGVANIGKAEYHLKIEENDFKINVVTNFKLQSTEEITFKGKKYDDIFGYVTVNAVIRIPKDELDQQWNMDLETDQVAPNMVVTYFISDIEENLEDARKAAEKAELDAELPPSYEKVNEEVSTKGTEWQETEPPDYEDDDILPDISDDELSKPPPTAA
jgi:hypothetical protein